MNISHNSPSDQTNDLPHARLAGHVTGRTIPEVKTWMDPQPKSLRRKS